MRNEKKNGLLSVVLGGVLVTAIFGGNAVKVGCQQVADAVRDLVPDGFKAQVAKADIESERRECAMEAAKVDQQLLSKYKGLLSSSFAELRAQDFKPFIKLMKATEEYSLCCGETSASGSLAAKLPLLKQQAELDLQRMLALSTRIEKLERVSGELQLVTTKVTIAESLNNSGSLCRVEKFVKNKIETIWHDITSRSFRGN
jgi:hypothetical protein